MLDAYQLAQLTNQSECFIHTHPKVPLDQTSGLELQAAQPIEVVAGGDTLMAAQDIVSIDPAGGSVTLNLPPATRSKEYHITMVGDGLLTLNPDGTDTICGETDAILTVKWTSLHLKANNNGNWIML